ncbi:FecCD family ABC transporter permease [Staphylococcus coagulans]|uniref:FecCD family ABC transporter permease n=1 Tax=Staphylococcus coagulans TaxID=74706 RepID=UPI0015FDE587|nr:iron ABC transporter permease [Staphylococcus coagulans]MBA8764318.1 iron chelate uptake ABC transporter family permease subunit [Staphylococcus coagulans]MBT2809778.1 iron ABC transporter permease [Staphylococcus coagulans]MBT2811920.1 iron ABC transporter permease [Staphylococcus coagulans]MBT2818970.1 iron ABC transporter permease [Staphylococcus coagulans]MBT2821342.1 iron ABC transporter permease [Staphylococcus coagulans]
MSLKPSQHLLIAGLCLIVVTVLSLMIGNTLVSLPQLIQAFFHFDRNNDIHTLITGARASRTLIALLTGAALSVSGLLMQVLTRNPVASPGLFGVNAGAVFFIVFSITFIQVSSFEALIVIAFIGAMLVTFLVVALGMFRQTQFSPQRVILAGASIAMLFTAFTQGILIMSETNLQGFLFWLAGSVSLRNIWEIKWIIPFLIVLICIAYCLSSRINILMTSDEIATGLGQNIKATKWLLILLISSLAGLSVALAGSIAFIGLIVPNISKALLPPNYKYLIPHSAIVGACLMMISDIVARMIIRPLELPVGVVTAVIGASVLIYLMRKGIYRL